MSLREEGVRSTIIEAYSRWTALSALRAGAPIKSRADVYGAINGIGFAVLFDVARGPIGRPEFDQWHTEEIGQLIHREPRLNVGWATKIVNIYLKTRAYVGAQGRPGLASAIHPPIDAGLWDGLAAKFANRPDILARTNCVRRIKEIVDYECYRRIVEGCVDAAAELHCDLIEVEQLWTGAEA